MYASYCMPIDNGRTDKASIEAAYDNHASAELGLDMAAAQKVGKELDLLRETCSGIERMQAVRDAFRELDSKGNATGRLTKEQTVAMVRKIIENSSRLVGGIMY